MGYVLEVLVGLVGELDVVRVTIGSRVGGKSTPFLAPEDSAGTEAVTIGVSENRDLLVIVVGRVI